MIPTRALQFLLFPFGVQPCREVGLHNRAEDNEAEHEKVEDIHDVYRIMYMYRVNLRADGERYVWCMIERSAGYCKRIQYICVLMLLE